MKPEEVRARVLADPLMRDVMVSADGRLVGILARLVPSDDRTATIPTLAERLERWVDGVPGGRRQAVGQFFRGGHRIGRPGWGSALLRVLIWNSSRS